MSSEDVAAAMRGDHDAFAALVGAATSRLYALASLILRDSDRAEDATQEAFVRAWRELPRLRDRIERAFRQLPLDQRTVLVLQHYFDLSHAEIAETVGIPVATVKSSMRYGIAAMRAALDSDDRSSTNAAERRSA